MEKQYTINDVVVTSYDNKGDDKGPAYEVLLGDSYNTSVLVLMYRKRGLKTAGGFYKGTLVHHKPQEVILVSGSMKLYFMDLGGGTREIILEAAQKLQIPPFVFHKYETLSDCVFLETKAHIFDKNDPDKYSYEEFLEISK